MFRKPFCRCSRFMIFGATFLKFTYYFIFSESACVLRIFSNTVYAVCPYVFNRTLSYSILYSLMYSTGLFLIQFCIQLSFLSFCLPFFKLSFSGFRFKERLNGGQQCSCERVNLIIWYTRGVLFLSRHFFPITFSPFQRLFS